MGNQSRPGLRDTQRVVKLSRGARALASPLLLLLAFVRCSAGELDAQLAEDVAEEAEGELDGQSSPARAGAVELGSDPEPAGEAELELGQLEQPLIDGAFCFPGTVACRDSGTAQRCVNGRVVSLPCPANTSCRNGSCSANQVCTPNAGLGCSGSARVVCNAAGTGSTILACGAGTTCSGAGQCVALPRVCTPFTRTCNGNILSTCNSLGTAVTTTTCSNGVCSPQLGCISIR